MATLTCYDCGHRPGDCPCPGGPVECLCVLTGDQADARDCPAHGPDSAAARRQREQEAAAEAAYWQAMRKF